ncbi:MAG: hypothetical protein FJX57_19950, partial [Alphaproteobacteria bacterium]|nr:hypothetical protein [Alphaproteobacteria bacterium]
MPGRIASSVFAALLRRCIPYVDAARFVALAGAEAWTASEPEDRRQAGHVTAVIASLAALLVGIVGRDGDRMLVDVETLSAIAPAARGPVTIDRNLIEHGLPTWVYVAAPPAPPPPPEPLPPIIVNVPAPEPPRPWALLDHAERRLKALEQRLDFSESERDRLENEFKRLQQDTATRTREIADRDRMLADRDQKLADHNRQIAERDRAMADRDRQIADRDRTMADRERQIADRERQMVDLVAGQSAALGRLAEQTSASVEVLSKLIARTGIDPERLIAAVHRENAVGGPLIQIAESQFVAVDAPHSGAAGPMVRLEALRRALSALPLESPIADGGVISLYGVRRDPFTGQAAMHHGLDLVGTPQAPVRSTAPGTVVTAGWQGEYGNLVEIDHGFGIRTRYAHLGRVNVKVGDVVGARVPLGIVGSTGRSTGPHLHYEVTFEGDTLDPMR